MNAVRGDSMSMGSIARKLSIYPELRNVCEFDLGFLTSGVRVLCNGRFVDHIDLLLDKIGSQSHDVSDSTFGSQ